MPSAMTATAPAPDSSADPAIIRRTIWGLSVFVCLAVTAVMMLVEPSAQQGSLLLPTLNAGLNGGAACCLVTGYVMIRKRRLAAHKVWMIAAIVFSSLFLVGYLAHHATAGSVRYQGEGLLRGVDYGLLIPHVLLAGPIVPLALFTLYRGWTGKLEKHRRIAKITLPLWLYVSVSGVLIYVMLYHTS